MPDETDDSLQEHNLECEKMWHGLQVGRVGETKEHRLFDE